MSGEFTYMRKYIVLDNSYTNIKNINPKGHGKIEVRGNKGNLSLNVENAEPERDYTIHFIKDINGRIKEQSVGRIIADERGRSRVNIDLNLQKLELEGFSIKRIDAILIRKGIDILLAGYINKNNGSIDRLINSLTVEPKEIAEVIEPEEIQEPIEEIKEVEKFEELIETEETFEPEELIDPVKIEEPEPEPPIEQEEVIEIEELEQVEQTEDPQNYKSLEYTRQLNHKNRMTDYILNIVKFFPFVQPLNHDLHGYSWWLIEDDGSNSYKGFLPYYNYLTASNYKYPYLNNSTDSLSLIKRYEHYLFGLYKEGEEVKYYLYGVPGEFTTEGHPFKGVTGFNTWYESENGIGYWIIYIDPMSGKVVPLLNPMVPGH